MNKPQALKSTKLIHRWGGIAVLVGMFGGSALGLGDAVFWAFFALAAGAGVVLEVNHWRNRARGQQAPASSKKAKALRVNKFLHRWTGLIWAAGMLLVFVGLPEGVLAVFLPMVVTGLVLHIRHWWLKLRRKSRKRVLVPVG